MPHFLSGHRCASVMFQTFSSVYMPLGTWVGVMVQSYHALTSVNVVSWIFRMQATPLPKLQ